MTWIKNGKRLLYLNRWDAYGGPQNQGWLAKYKQQRTNQKGFSSSLRTFKIEQSGRGLSGQKLVQHLRYHSKLATIIYILERLYNKTHVNVNDFRL